MRSDLTVQAGSLCYFARRPRLDLVLSNLLIRDQDNHANDRLLACIRYTQDAHATMTAGASLVDQALRQMNPKADLQAIIRYVSSGVWRLLLN